jgi:hypothetical protein
MSLDTYTLLQNEAFLIDGCFKASLSGILSRTNAKPGPLYAAFFHYAIGLERLLKVLLILDSWHDERKFPDNAKLKEYGGSSGHDLVMLHEYINTLFSKYYVDRKSKSELDAINTELLKFLADFANGSRYYNLDSLAKGTAKAEKNPIYRWQRLFYQIYQQDHPNPEPIESMPDMPEDDMTRSQLTGHHIIFAVTCPHVCWRMVQLLDPLKKLLIVLQRHVWKDDLAKDGPNAGTSVPFMDDFLEFVCSDKETFQVAIRSEDWPYQD